MSDATAQSGSSESDAPTTSPRTQPVAPAATATVTATATATATGTATATATTTDDGLPPVPAWLDEIEGERAMAWVEERNAATRAAYEGDPDFERLRAGIGEILDSPDRIPVVSEAAGLLYNHWTDAEHPRGLWRRTTWESYRAGAPTADGTEWDVLLDLDALGEAEGTTWVWHGAQVLRHGPLAGRRALVDLSEGGSDTDITRELDLDTRAFVPASEGGFTRGPSKGMVAWADDEGASVLLTDDRGEGSLTESGYPREVLRLRRGQSAADGELLLAAPASSVIAYSYRDAWGRIWVGYHPDFYTEELWLLPGGAATLPADAARTAANGEPLVAPGARHIDVPTSAEVQALDDWLVVTLREDWELDGTIHPAGGVLAARLEEFLAGSREMTTLFTPTPSTSVQGVSTTRHHLLLHELDDVLDRVEVLTPREDGTWDRCELDPAAGQAGSGSEAAPSAPGTEGTTAEAASQPEAGRSTDGGPLRPGRALATMSAGPVAAELDDRIWLTTSSFTSPAALAVAELAEDGSLAGSEVLRRAPERFDASGVVASQHVAVSADGTRVPYFEIGRPRVDGAGRAVPGPTILYGYGGFEVPLGVSYLPVTGRAWLERGGTYVIANLRGGGEYGPSWHRAGLRQHRHRVYEDLEAVARALIERGVASPDTLAVHGGSNGGLLVGNALTRFPDLLGAVLCEVPLLDMRRYTHLLAGASWAAEYGDPDDPEQWAFIRGFSPFHMLEPGRAYPPVLLVTSTRDDRVHPAHARTMAHRMLAMGADVTYFENSEGGHGRASTNAQRAFVHALEHEFAWRRLGGR